MKTPRAAVADEAVVRHRGSASGLKRAVLVMMVMHESKLQSVEKVLATKRFT